MQFKEFLNTCQNELTSVNVYFEQEDWDDLVPEFTFDDMRKAKDEYYYREVEAWFIDANFSLHVLLSY